MATVEKAFLVGTHDYSFRPGVPAEITGVLWVKPDGLDLRICYAIRFADGYEDYVPMADAVNFNIIPEADADEILTLLALAEQSEADEDTATEPGLDAELEAEIDAVMAQETPWEPIRDDAMDDDPDEELRYIADDDDGSASDGFDPIVEAERNAALAHN